MATKERKIRKGMTVICALWDRSKVAIINYYNPQTGEVSLRYRGDKGEYQAKIEECVIV
ncbi:hypothetical protein JGH11_18795 [Dysgonomonas sp. Marseille-P4677]|uniref:hypothetical protein n=1 Tax=Dysgonomonas sp. Marseille-P4677 TaxID=2364790 RepID=UPI001914D1E9|nr:hypothetical protein [Dysgonomonas sp. Marseille-P4677]MBK5722921.1 hypothetical protein [Dysgonomonas sp. Marseille-P4677]